MITDLVTSDPNALESADMVESSTPDAFTAVLSMTVDADPDTVFVMFTRPARLAAWFWPPSYAAVYQTNPKPGGTFMFRSTGRPRGENVGLRGIYGKISRPDLLTFIWAWDGDRAPASQVSVRMRPLDKGTEVTVVHGENPTEEQRDEHLKEWHGCLTRLADHLTVG